MYKLLIIDDHQYIINGILNNVELDKLNIRFVGSANSGNVGIRLIAEQSPDIVIVDIELPDMTGIDIIKASKKYSSDIKFIILSGHSEFSYAKEAITLNVIEYILKPVLPEKLQEILKQTVKKIENEKYLASVSVRLNENLPIIRENFIEDLFDGKIVDEQEYLSKINFLNLPFENKMFKCLCVKINYSTNPALSLENFRIKTETTILDNLSKIFQIEKTYVNFKNGIAFYLMYFNKDTENHFSDLSLKKSLIKIIKRMKDNGNIFVSFYIGRPVSSYKDIKTTYLQSKECLKKSFLSTKSDIVFYNDIEKYDYIDVDTGSYNKAKLSEYISSGDIFASKEYVLSLLDKLTTVKGTNIEQIKKISVSILYTILKSLYSDEIYSAEFSELTDTFATIAKATNHSEINIFWETFFNNLENVIFPEYSTTDKIINKVKNHISKHYAENITLDVIARETYCSPSYISTLFLKKVGISYKEYLTNFRMKKAYELLSTGRFKVYEVSNMVGYKKTDHFRKIFQRYFNITPREIENSSLIKYETNEKGK